MSIQNIIRASLEQEDQEPQEKAPTEEVFSNFDAAYHSQVCAGCSCLCDDISCYLNKGQITRTLNLCEIGWQRLNTVFSEDRVAPPSPTALAGQIRDAARLLQHHQPALIIGSENLDETSIRVSRKLAQAQESLWLPWCFAGVHKFYERAKQYGWASALLDDVRDQADLVIFWRADPLDTHHRHLSRYSFFACGRYTERGHHDRNLVAVASGKPIIEPLCQQFFDITPDQDQDLVQQLLAPALSQGFDHRDLPLLVNALQRASSIALFVDPEKTDEATLDLMFQWSASINSEGRQRLLLLPLWNAGANIEGFCQVCLENDASAWGTDFSKASSERRSLDLDWPGIAEQVHSVLVIEGGATREGIGNLPEPLAGKPLVVLDPFKKTSAHEADIVIHTALPGVESDGVFLRADGLPLAASRMEALVSDNYPSASEVLEGILAEII